MQILVVVANIQVRTLKAEVEKGFVRTAVGHELIDPKAEINLENGTIGRFGGHQGSSQCRKGSRLIFLHLAPEVSGNASDPEDANQFPGKSSLFLLTDPTTLESHCVEIGPEVRKSISPFEMSGAKWVARENSGELYYFWAKSYS